MLTDFLHERIAEDEGDAHSSECTCAEFIPDGLGHFATCSQRAWADCQAKRRIIESVPVSGNQDAERGATFQYQHTLRHLAAVYADHPDYRDEWKP